MQLVKVSVCGMKTRVVNKLPREILSPQSLRIIVLVMTDLKAAPIPLQLLGAAEDSPVHPGGLGGT